MTVLVQGRRVAAVHAAAHDCAQVLIAVSTAAGCYANWLKVPQAFCCVGHIADLPLSPHLAERMR